MKNNIIPKTLLIFATTYTLLILLGSVIEYLLQISLPLPEGVLVIVSCLISIKYFLTKQNRIIEKNEKVKLIYGSVIILTTISYLITFVFFFESIRYELIDFISIKLIISVLVNYVMISISYYIILKILQRNFRK